MLGRLRGMFALAIWDGAQRELFLARDPHGIKPLYTADDGRTFRAASQVKALLARPEFKETPESIQKVRDLSLAAHVRAALRQDFETASVNVMIVACQGAVLLKGMVADESEIKGSERVAKTVSGVKSVAMDLKVIGGRR